MRARRDVAAAVAATVASALPVFLVGSVAVQLRASLHFGAGALGGVVALYYLGAAVCSSPFGRLVEAIGGLRTMRIAAVASTVLLALIALLARSWLVLAVLMVPAGMASAAMQPAANLFLARRVPEEEQGLAFGLKQAAVPFATLLGGLAVPALALTVGWQWAFVAGAAWGAAVSLLLPRPRESLAARRQARTRRTAAPARMPLILLAGGFGLGVGAASALTTFLVSSAVAAGVGRGTAGLLAALGGAAAVSSRVVTGALADRRGRAHLPVVAGMLGVGSLGYLALALVVASHLTVLLVPVVVLTFAAGWGWNGLFNFAIVRTHREQPARATGITQTGGRIGGVLGPLLFGLVVAHGSYALAWALTAAAALSAAGVTLAGRRLLSRRLVYPEQTTALPG